MATENDKELQKVIEAGKPATDNRLTIEKLDAVIAGKPEYTVLGEERTTICRLSLVNGFVIIGVATCADPLNFNKKAGEKAAYNKAFAQLWPLEGYLLKQRMYEKTLTEELNK